MRNPNYNNETVKYVGFALDNKWDISDAMWCCYGLVVGLVGGAIITAWVAL